MSHQIRIRKHRCLKQLPRVVLIEASAGTGKTFAIERMVAEFVLEERLPIQNILVVTFTRKAASEMRARIYEALEKLQDAKVEEAAAGEPAWVITPEARALLGRALADFDQAPISTIQSFCQSVLDEQLILTGAIRDPASPDTRALFHDAFVEHLRRVPPKGGMSREVLEQWIVLGGGVNELESILRSAAGAVAVSEDPLDRIRPRIDPAALARPKKELIAAFAGRIPDTENELKEAGAGQEKDSVLTAFRNIQALCSRRDLVSLGPMGFQLRFLQAADLLINEKILGFKDPGKVTGRTGELMRACRNLFLQAPTREAVAVHAFLAPVVHAYEQACRQRGALDTGRLLQETRRALREDRTGGLRERLRQRFRVALVDEFQDTDEVQWEILNTVFVEGNGTRFVAVGDPKQATWGRSFRRTRNGSSGTRSPASGTARASR